MVDPASLIDEVDFLRRGDDGTAALLEAGRRDGHERRAKAMARLLTELDDPSSLAAVVSADIAVEKDVLHYLTALIDAHTDPGTWPLSHGAIAQTLARLEADTQRCDVRLAARLADQEAGTMSVVPSPAEETDPVLRLWAARLKDAEHTVKIRNDLHTATEEHVQRIIQIRRDAQ